MDRKARGFPQGQRQSRADFYSSICRKDVLNSVYFANGIPQRQLVDYSKSFLNSGGQPSAFGTLLVRI